MIFVFFCFRIVVWFVWIFFDSTFPFFLLFAVGLDVFCFGCCSLYSSHAFFVALHETFSIARTYNLVDVFEKRREAHVVFESMSDLKLSSCRPSMNCLLSWCLALFSPYTVYLTEFKLTVLTFGIFSATHTLFECGFDAIKSNKFVIRRSVICVISTFDFIQ